jgi:hypothetical protein
MCSTPAAQRPSTSLECPRRCTPPNQLQCGLEAQSDSDKSILLHALIVPPSSRVTLANCRAGSHAPPPCQVLCKLSLPLYARAPA